jgi:hypothetical protein
LSNVECMHCQSSRIVNTHAKCSDLITQAMNGNEYEGTVILFGGSDYLEFNVCLDCGKLQDHFPMSKTRLDYDRKLVDLATFYVEEGDDKEEWAKQRAGQYYDKVAKIYLTDPSELAYFLDFAERNWDKAIEYAEEHLLASV